MAYPWSSVYLLEQFNRLLGRPQADAVTPASKYQRLSEAQSEIVTDIAAICPRVLYPDTAYASLPTLTTTDNQVFTFGTDTNGFLIRPMGKVGIYPSLTCIPDSPWRSGVDYIDGTTSIRIPNNSTYTGTLYWWGITSPGVIDGSGNNEPVLYPEGSRELIAYRAASGFCFEAMRNPDMGMYLQTKYTERWVNWLTTWRTSFRTGGVLGTSFTGMRLALASGAPSGWGG